MTWRIPKAPNDSSYITNIIIYLNGAKHQNVSRGIKQIDIERLKPNTSYNVEIETEDDSFQKSIKTSKSFKTKETGKHSRYIYILPDRYVRQNRYQAPLCMK